MTAAHCIVGRSQLYQVQLGEHNTETDPDCEKDNKTNTTKCADPPQLLKPAEPIVHPGYSSGNTYHYDIALIPLKEPAQFTNYVFPIFVAKTLSEGSEMWFSGWGKESTLENPSVIKQKISLPWVNRTYCVDKYKSQSVNILDSQFCAGGEKGRDACGGDSGGPVMIYRVQWIAQGIVSFGTGCGTEGWPGVYTSIPSYLEWLKIVAERYLNEHGLALNARR